MTLIESMQAYYNHFGKDYGIYFGSECLPEDEWTKDILHRIETNTPQEPPSYLPGREY